MRRKLNKGVWQLNTADKDKGADHSSNYKPSPILKGHSSEISIYYMVQEESFVFANWKS